MFSPDLPHVPPNVAVRQASIAFAGFAALFVVLNFIKPEVPAIRRVYPHDGLVAELGGLEENKVSSTHFYSLACSIVSRREQSL